MGVAKSCRAGSLRRVAGSYREVGVVGYCLDLFGVAWNWWELLGVAENSLELLGDAGNLQGLGGNC